jgi:hypothetical protein
MYWIGGRAGLEISMRPTLAVTTAVLLFLGGGVAEAAGSNELAETGGFLLGNALRCGVPTERVERATNVIHELIVAASLNSNEESTANSRFTEIFLANVFPDREGVSLIPRCEVVIAQFERLERHHQRSGLKERCCIGRSVRRTLGDL